MFKGLLISIISYTLFIVLPFLYLLASVYTLLTNHPKLALHMETPKAQKIADQIYRA